MKLVVVIVAFVGSLCSSGCSLVPEARTRDVLHNPFPQMKRVAVLPFFNQSDNPHVDGEAVAKGYYAALQAIPGFEVLPVGVTAMQWQAYTRQFGEPRGGADFQRLAQMMDVEAIVVGSVTDFDAYYPPRMALTTHWYAANEGFHAIPPGYGLPWGTKAEEDIPARIVRESEFELARSQLKTQAPQPAPPAEIRPAPPVTQTRPDGVSVADYQIAVEEHRIDAFGAQPMPGDGDVVYESEWQDGPMTDDSAFAATASLPPAWPDPTDLIPDPPSPVPPTTIPNSEPVLTHTRIYRGDDPYFTQRLADFVETGDDARGTSWHGYVKRSDDFVRFCCHLHLTEMLEARGGRDASDVILRWPLSRY